MRITRESPTADHLVSLFVARLLESRVNGSAGIRAGATPKNLRIRCGTLSARLTFAADEIRVRADDGREAADAEIAGSMPVLLGVCNGGSWILPFLRGDLRARGSPGLLLKCLRLFRG